MKRLLTQPPPVAVWPVLSRDKLALPSGTVYWPGALPGPRPGCVVLSRHRRAAPSFSCAPSILTSCSFRHCSCVPLFFLHVFTVSSVCRATEALTVDAIRCLWCFQKF